MPVNKVSGSQIRQTFIDFFVERGHTFVPSSSLVPHADPTLLFTNAGMVQFKDVFLGQDKRPYTRAVNSQKCMRVAGKHNDLEDVGRDDTHHTFFEMLGNWSFGDYYKKESIQWAWELLTEVWGLPRKNMWATCFEDELGEIERDDEAAGHWREQPGFDPSHVLFFGRKDNFWEMAETGPCGPNSEIHIDLGPEACNMQGVPGHECRVNGDCSRFLELWNLVFIQYNRTGPRTLETLPNKHVDTGMGFERIVSVLQGVNSNYRTDLFIPVMQTIQDLAGHTDEEREANLTPYRVIADHGRAAAFLIADGVIPGNTGRNYVCRMIVRRASRFGSKIGLNEPFLARVAEAVIETYGEFYPELTRNRAAIQGELTQEEIRFHRTLESGVAKLDSLMRKLRIEGERVMPGDQAFDLYATYGLPLEITRDIAQENDFSVDETGFMEALEEHRIASGAGDTFGALTGEGDETYRRLRSDLQDKGLLALEGVAYNPYDGLEVEAPVLALIRDGQVVRDAKPGDRVEVVLPETCFYVEAGGQVSDTGWIYARSTNGDKPAWEIHIDDVRKPVGGLIIHIGEVMQGAPRTGDAAIARVDAERRQDIMRNHTATHLLHSELRAVLGDHARQAGSLVAPDRLRFDFTHPEPVTPEELSRIEEGVNRKILDDYRLEIRFKPLQQAINEGAIALFGEKYADTVRTINIGGQEPFSYELCGGTHVSETGDIGLFLITSESSIAAGIRRIEAVTGRGAYEIARSRFELLNDVASLLETTPEQAPAKIKALIEDLTDARKQIASMKKVSISSEFERILQSSTSEGDGPIQFVDGIPILTAILPEADAETLRNLTDRFRQRYSTGVAVLASTTEGRPTLVAAITEDLVERGLHAAELVKAVAAPLGGGGGGKPTLAQAGGREADKLPQALSLVASWVKEKLDSTQG